MLNTTVIRDIVERALAEDAPWGDITSDGILPPHATSTALVNAREAGVMSGGQVLVEAFAGLKVHLALADGNRFDAGQNLAEVAGQAHELLGRERVALNLLQRMCGIATLTQKYVNAVKGTGVRIVDTRKTTPGLRQLEKHAVVCGGGHNHRHSLSDAILVKDNHLAIARDNGFDVTSALARLRDKVGHTTHIEVEVDRLEQLETILGSGSVDTVLLDNFSLDDLRTAVDLVSGRVLVEASGGIDLEMVRDVADTGVDIISVGALTHSARALDIGLDIESQ